VLSQAGQGGVAAVGELEHHALAEHGAGLADQRGPVGGDHRPQADGGAFPQDLQQ
jgi:hypothetical protein